MRQSNAAEAGSMHGILVELLGWLDARNYDFTTVTPETHRRVLARRPGAVAQDLREAFGWSLPFEENLLPADLFTDLVRHGWVRRENGRSRLRLRASRVRGELFLHSAYPTDRPDAVFLGPDSYRFADMVVSHVRGRSGGACLDIGAGAGVGAIIAAKARQTARTVLTDVNPLALALARANAEFAGVAIETALTADARTVSGDFEVILANPPFIDDAQRLTYRHGGRLGLQTALNWTEQALDKLSAGGLFVLYCGAPIIGGEDLLRAALARLCAATDVSLSYREIDPDIFGEQLDEPEYANVERIAAVCARMERR